MILPQLAYRLALETAASEPYDSGVVKIAGLRIISKSTVLSCIFIAFSYCSTLIGSVSGRRQENVEAIDCNTPAFVVSRSSFSRMAKCKPQGRQAEHASSGQDVQALNDPYAGYSVSICRLHNHQFDRFCDSFESATDPSTSQVCWRAVVRSMVRQLTQIPRSDGIIIECDT